MNANLYRSMLNALPSPPDDDAADLVTECRRFLSAPSATNWTRLDSWTPIVSSETFRRAAAIILDDAEEMVAPFLESLVASQSQ